MEIKIKLNDMKYRYDVYQMFNIYFPLDEIKFLDDGDYIVNILDNKVEFINSDYYKETEISENIKEDIKRLVFSSLKDITEEEYPWGILVGIRPSKIALKYLEEGKTEEEIIEIFKKKHLASEEKAKLCIEIAKTEVSFVNNDSKNIAIYIGMAFCPTRCFYCSFAANPIMGNKKLVNPYLEALIYEIREMKKYIDERGLNIETVYFGGGTPTAVNNEEFELIMQEAYDAFVKGKGLKEFTVECGRPDSITKEKLATMKKFNVTRISINPQTMNDETLEKIGRAHSVSDIVDCFNMAREIGFDNINMDLILGLVDEDLEMVRNTLEEIKKLNPESLTVHTLAVKRASKLKEDIENYELTRYEEMIKMIDLSMEYAKEMGLNPYYMYRQKHMLGNLENIGYAKEGYECIYNIQIMEEKQSNYALGAGSISKFVYVDEDRIERVENVKNVEQYIDRVDEMIERKRKEIYQNVN